MKLQADEHLHCWLCGLETTLDGVWVLRWTEADERDYQNEQDDQGDPWQDETQRRQDDQDDDDQSKWYPGDIVNVRDFL